MPICERLAGSSVRFEERAEDRRLDAAPVVLAQFRQRLDLGNRQFDDFGIGEQSAVEIGDFIGPEVSAGAHGGEQGFELRRQSNGIELGGGQHFGEKLARQQADVLAEQAEHDLHQEMGRLRRGDATDAQPVGELSKTLGRFFCDGLRRAPRTQRLGVAEQPPQHIEVGGLGEAGQIEGMHLFDRAGEVGVDLETVQVADDQQRRVFEGFAVEQQLVVGGYQVLVLAFVLPAEVAALPDVGPAVAAAGLADAALEGVEGSLGIGRGRLVLAQQFADVEKVLLAGAAFGEVGPLPLGDKVLWGHARLPEEKRRELRRRDCNRGAGPLLARGMITRRATSTSCATVRRGS